MRKEVSVVEMTDVKCPLCDAGMRGKTDSKTFIWICKECPGVLFEYNNDDDMKALNNMITENDSK